MSRSASYTHAHAHAHAHTLLTTGHAHAHACPPSTSNLLGKETRQYRRVMRVPGDSLRVEVNRWLKANVHSLSDTSVVTSGAWTFGKISWLISDLQPHERPMCSDLQPHIFSLVSRKPSGIHGGNRDGQVAFRPSCTDMQANSSRSRRGGRFVHYKPIHYEQRPEKQWHVLPHRFHDGSCNAYTRFRRIKRIKHGQYEFKFSIG